MDDYNYMRLPGYRGGTIEYYWSDVIVDEYGVATYLEGCYTSLDGDSFWGRLNLEDGHPSELELVDANGHTVDYIYF